MYSFACVRVWRCVVFLFVVFCVFFCLQIFDVSNFDMACLVSLDFIPWACEFVSKKGDATPLVAVYAHPNSSPLLQCRHFFKLFIVEYSF